MDASGPSLRDPLIGRALALLHADPSRRWTLAELAAASGSSRSSFAARFTTSIGCPPMQYLARRRMQLAADRLRAERIKIAAVAQDIGYESEAAFSRAFKKYSGHAPGRWRRSSSAPCRRSFEI